ncbi:MAG TPA: M50 family metallopeptidase [Solirubrobacteraceae bacterium]|jgi:regulator of sigma E protease|nr:M50 family metallopeptidase [Solirubrobacteraceae bacterium]
MSWLLTILGIMALIVLHELGHFAVAKAVGMRVERFSLFFPPRIAGIKRGETEYMIGAIPAGGYVKITGMNPDEIKSLAPEVAARAYYAQPPWKRVVVILAGPGMNLLITFVLFWLVLLSGSLSGAVTLSNLSPSVQTLEPTTSVQAIEKGEPAYGVLRPADKILAVDGRSVTVSSATETIASHRCVGAPRDGCRARTPVTLTIRRAGRVLTVSTYPRYSKQVGRMLVGFDFGYTPKSFGVVAAAGAALSEMWGTTTTMVSNIGKAFTSAKVRKEFHSIVGITVIAQEAVVAGPGYALVFLGFVSLALAVINLFPFLPLDGGHVLWAVAEKLRGRRVSLTAMWRFSSVGILLLLFLVVNGVGNDITRLGG